MCQMIEKMMYKVNCSQLTKISVHNKFHSSFVCNWNWFSSCWKSRIVINSALESMLSSCLAPTIHFQASLFQLQPFQIYLADLQLLTTRLYPQLTEDSLLTYAWITPTVGDFLCSQIYERISQNICIWPKKARDYRAMYHRPQLCRRDEGDGEPEEDGEGGEGVVGTRYKRTPARGGFIIVKRYKISAGYTASSCSFIGYWA